ncbi:transcriptional antiterminator/mannitol/fructose-specific phosphotransferase system IIA component (Ntr-type) [Symbiobacterium terraclitae]|uniref:Transcriptional antiterminator/mannitol/fructose-specific phosphotransferase system IIA component (Ntr-type) n=1 Tax=Symbiobacterium terraclitae TaxID=557451 RepID=A0ABS4JT46_9FIRM|nr:transcriptional antiterminator/mannitol/fructose-specific phosphotransferase system IIA component (Ntr-type) [Symbiobacterium terraclitae]
MLNDRRQRLLRLLLAASGPLPATEIGRLLGYPARSVRYDLEALSDWVAAHGVQLVSTAGVGYQLEGETGRLREYLDRFVAAEAPPGEYIPSPRERVRRLLLMLLSDEAPRRLGDLADRLGVGKSTVHADLAAAESWASRRGLALVRGHAGICLQGTEGHWRQAIADLVGELADEAQLALLLEDHPDSEPLQALLRPLLPHVAWGPLGDLMREFGAPELSVHVAVMISRLYAGHTLSFSPGHISRGASSPCARQAQAICQALQERFAIRIPHTELAALALQLEAARAVEAVPETGIATREDLELAEQMAILVETRLGIALRQDREFLMGLALHLGPIALRLRRGEVVENPLLDEVRAKYPAACLAAQDVGRALSAIWGLKVPDPEVGYLAIHIAAAMEREKLRRRPPPRALLVCSSGVGTSSLLLTRLRSLLPEIQPGRVVSAFRMREVLAEDPHDLVIATCQVPPCGLPVVRVSPLLGEDDVVRVRRTAQTLQSEAWRGRQPVLRDLLTAETVALDVEAQTWEEAIRAGGALLVNAGLAEPRYVEAMVRTAREFGPYIVLGPGFALPHARPEDGVLRLGMSMIRLRQPVPFGHPENDPVSLVVCLGAIDHETHLKALMQLSELLGNRDAVAALQSAPDVATVLRLVGSVSGRAEEADRGEAT